MQKILLMVSAALVLTACNPPPPESNNECSNQAGAQPVNIQYGDSQIKVVPPLYEVKKNKNLKFRLMADNVNGPGGLDYATVNVTIKSKGPGNQWLDISGTEEGTNPLIVCMPADQPLGEISYLVEVDQVGVLDPRVRVIP